MFLIFKESINNIVRHANCSDVHVTFNVENEWLILRIEDNGCGFGVVSINNNGQAKSNGKGGNGLLNMKRRAEELRGSYMIESTQGEGTTVTLRIPLVVKAESKTV